MNLTITKRQIDKTQLSSLNDLDPFMATMIPMKILHQIAATKSNEN
jgi:hypothetical protein